MTLKIQAFRVIYQQISIFSLRLSILASERTNERCCCCVCRSKTGCLSGSWTGARSVASRLKFMLRSPERMHRDSLCYYRGMENLCFERTHYHVHNMQRAVQNIPINSNYPKAPSKYPINGHPLFLHASDIYIWGRSFRITILSCTGRSGYKLHRSRSLPFPLRFVYVGTKFERQNFQEIKKTPIFREQKNMSVFSIW